MIRYKEISFNLQLDDLFKFKNLKKLLKFINFNNPQKYNIIS